MSDRLRGRPPRWRTYPTEFAQILDTTSQARTALHQDTTGIRLSFPVTLKDATTRLFHLASEYRRSSNPQSPPPAHGSRALSARLVDLDAESRRQVLMRCERHYHRLLTRSGGRPWYNIDLMGVVSRWPTRHAAVLWIWQGDFPELNSDRWAVFEGQWAAWAAFRKRQVADRWKFRNRMHKLTEKVSARLTFYLVSHELELKYNVEQQDKLSTWYEYLAFELHRHELMVAGCRAREAAYERQWRKLKNAGVLGEHETREWVESAQFKVEFEADALHRRHRVESAGYDIMTTRRAAADHPVPHSLAAYRQQQDYEMELFRVFRAYDVFVQRRTAVQAFFSKTASYRALRRQAHRQSHLLSWIRNEVFHVRQEVADEAGRENEDPADSSETSEWESDFGYSSNEDLGDDDLSDEDVSEGETFCEDTDYDSRFGDDFIDGPLSDEDASEEDLDEMDLGDDEPGDEDVSDRHTAKKVVGDEECPELTCDETTVSASASSTPASPASSQRTQPPQAEVSYALTDRAPKRALTDDSDGEEQPKRIRRNSPPSPCTGEAFGSSNADESCPSLPGSSSRSSGRGRHL